MLAHALAALLLVPVDLASWKALTAKALAATPRVDGNLLIYELKDGTSLAAAACPPGTKPENKLKVFRQKNNRYPLQDDVDIELVCTDSRGFLAAGYFVRARSGDGTITSAEMYTGAADRKASTVIIVQDGKLQSAPVDFSGLQKTLAEALRGLQAGR